MNIINNYNQNPYCQVINEDFNKWNKIKTKEEFQSWKNNVPKLGTYGTISISEFLSNNRDSIEVVSEYALICYLAEIQHD